MSANFLIAVLHDILLEIAHAALKFASVFYTCILMGGTSIATE